MIQFAAKSADWGSPREFFEVNVTGTRNVVAECQTHGIKKKNLTKDLSRDPTRV